MSYLESAPMPEPVIKGSVLYGADELVARMVAQRLPHLLANQRGFGPCVALGVVRRGQLIGGVVYHNFFGHSVEVSLAFDRPDWATPDTLRQLFSYPFEQLNVTRMEAMIGRRNKRARKFIKGLGFHEEGCHRRKLSATEDAFSYGMLKDECRWLKRAIPTLPVERVRMNG